MTSIDFAKRSGLINYKRKAGMMDRRFIPRVKEVGNLRFQSYQN